MKSKTLLSLFIIAITLLSCGSSDTIANQEIDKDLRSAIQFNNTALLNALSNSDQDALEELGSERFNKFLHAKINNVVRPFRKGFLTPDFVVYDEYYTSHGSKNEYHTIENPERDYTFSYNSHGKETYVSLLKCSYVEMDDYLITIIYSKEGDKWKVDDLELGSLGMYGKTSNEFYAEAMKYKEKDMLLSAFYSIDAARGYAKPAGDLLKYNKEKEIGFYAKRWSEKAANKYHFPFMPDGISSNPSIEEVTIIKNIKGVYPLIKYSTNIPVRNLTELKAEMEQVKIAVKKKYTDIDFNKGFVYYRAHHKSENGQIDEYTFEEML